MASRRFALGVIILLSLVSETTVCTQRTGAAASVERRRREPDRATSRLARAAPVFFAQADTLLRKIMEE